MDLRALVAQGTSTLIGIEYLDRGYERLQEKLRGVGARLNEWIKTKYTIESLINAPAIALA